MPNHTLFASTPHPDALNAISDELIRLNALHELIVMYMLSDSTCDGTPLLDAVNLCQRLTAGLEEDTQHTWFNLSADWNGQLHPDNITPFPHQMPEISDD